MNTIRFYRGEENGIVKEETKFSESLFKEQYVQALLAIDKILAHPTKTEPSIVAFCGDRGEGKSSCMATVTHLIKSYSKSEGVKTFIDETRLPEWNNGIQVVLKDRCANIIGTKMEILDTIDPAFFDTYHNVLELILGQMYERFLAYVNKEENKEEMRNRRDDKEKLMNCFHTAKYCWSRISNVVEKQYDPLDELDTLAAGLSLREKMDELISEYLTFFHKDQKSQLVVCIDDLDLNIGQAYEMAEQIRKYLVSEKCILLISLNANQLVDVVANYLDRLTAPNKDLGTPQMATKYVTKLVPLECRIIMPKMYDICNKKLEIYQSREGEIERQFNSVKEAVVQLTYNKTRFLFYNSKGGVSPLVPNNLRSLRHLMGMLLSMPDFVDNKSSLSNKNVFRSYFYQTWTRQLKKEDQVFASLLVKGDDATAVNKLVVDYLGKQIRKTEGTTGLVHDICNPVNYNYNVSVGDVFYIINYLERSNVDEALKLMLFFIKSYYSIHLYEYYDIISEVKGELSPKYTLDGEVYKNDGWFKRTNMMQRFVNGSYFTYAPTDLLPPTVAKKNRDLKSFKAKMLYDDVLKDVKEGISRFNDMEPEEEKVFKQKFRVAEFFALTVKKSISRRKVENADRLRRDFSEPFYLTDFNTNTYYLIFDVLSPFYNILNPKYTYERFAYMRHIEGEYKGFYEFALEQNWSLLRRMIDYVRLKEHNEGLNDDQQLLNNLNQLPALTQVEVEEALLRLISNATLRNGEVLSAVMETIQSQRENWHNSRNSLEVIDKFYSNIINSEMRTYNNESTDRPYIMRFVFLNAFRELLTGKYLDEAGVRIDDVDLLNAIYSSDYDTNNITDEDIMYQYQKFFNSFKTTKKGKMVVSDFGKLYPDFFTMIGESEWSEKFVDDQSYNKTSIIKILRERFVQHMSVALNSEVSDIEDVE